MNSEDQNNLDYLLAMSNRSKAEFTVWASGLTDDDRAYAFELIAAAHAEIDADTVDDVTEACSVLARIAAL
jgi:hypothetical protein